MNWKWHEIIVSLKYESAFCTCNSRPSYKAHFFIRWNPIYILYIYILLLCRLQGPFCVLKTLALRHIIDIVLNYNFMWLNVDNGHSYILTNVDTGHSYILTNVDTGHSYILTNVDTGHSYILTNVDTGHSYILTNVDTGHSYILTNVDTGHSYILTNVDTGHSYILTDALVTLPILLIKVNGIRSNPRTKNK